MSLRALTSSLSTEVRSIGTDIHHHGFSIASVLLISRSDAAHSIINSYSSIEININFKKPVCQLKSNQTFFSLINRFLVNHRIHYSLCEHILPELNRKRIILGFIILHKQGSAHSLLAALRTGSIFTNLFFLLKLSGKTLVFQLERVGIL